MVREFTQQVGNLQCQPQSEGDSNLHPNFDGGTSPFPVEAGIGQDGLKDLCAWEVGSCGDVTVHLLWEYSETYPTNLTGVCIPETHKRQHIAVLSFVTSFCFLTQS